MSCLSPFVAETGIALSIRAEMRITVCTVYFEAVHSEVIGGVERVRFEGTLVLSASWHGEKATKA